MKKYLSLIVVPHDDSRMRNYRLSYRLAATFGVLSVLLVLVVVFFVGTYGRLLLKAHEADILATENEQLMQRNEQIDSLRTELVHLQTMGIQIKKMLGVGLSVEDSTLVANLSPIVRARAILDDNELTDAAKSEQKELLRSIPSLWPIRGYVTREFFVTGGESSQRFHPGMDIAARRNIPIRASAEGVVLESKWDDTYGYMVSIDHGFGITTLYGHNTRNLVRVGDRVARGQTIGFVGSTGKSTAPHVHYEVRKNGVSVDPRNYLFN